MFQAANTRTRQPVPATEKAILIPAAEPYGDASDLEVHGCHGMDFGVVMEMGLDLDRKRLPLLYIIPASQ